MIDNPQDEDKIRRRDNESNPTRRE